MKEKWGRIKYTILGETGKLFGIYKYYLLVFFIIFLICFITGILTCASYSADISCGNLINKYLHSYLCKDTTYIGFFLMLSLYFLIFTLFITLLTRNVFIIIIDGIIFVFFSYILGFDVCIIVISLGLAGVIFGILIYGLLNILIFINIILIISIACKRVKDRKKMCHTFDNSQYIKIYIFLIVIGEILLFLLSILFGIIHIFVIVD
ncbi:MAG: hypothetical protein ACI4PF_01255 [Christensenellales bacterium]